MSSGVVIWIGLFSRFGPQAWAQEVDRVVPVASCTEEKWYQHDEVE